MKDFRLLIVDDDEALRVMLKKMAARFSLPADTAGTGEDALRIMKKRLAEGAPYPVMIVDWKMPGIDGLETARRVRGQEGLKHTAIILMATFDSAYKELEKTAAGLVDGFLLKPVDTNHLIASLKQWIPAAGTARPKERPASGIIPAEPEAEAELPVLPGIDLKDAMKRLGGNRNLLFSLIRNFFSQYGDAARELKDLLPRDREAAYRKAHTLKGVTGNIGAKELYLLFKDLEEAVKYNRQEVVNDRLPKVKEVLEAMKRDILPLVQEEAAGGPGAHDPAETDSSAVTALFGKLEDLLGKRDLEAEDRFQDLKQILIDTPYRLYIRKLSDNLEQFNYSEALVTLGQLKTAFSGG
ncbi:MAG: response regulator [Spirochaetales bacterium]|nr:MAG: response regulator [Spirochaetales bacterium]